MKKNLLFLFIFFLAACSTSTTYQKAEDAQDAGRQFIRASLDGDYDKAKFYMLQDTTNLVLFERQERNYRELTPDQKRAYREAAIRPVEIRQVNDSQYIYKYYSSYNAKDTTTLRVVKKDGEWLVDMKSIINQ